MITAERELSYGLDPVASAIVAERLKPAVLLFSLGIILFLFLLPLFNAPFERDQGTYATIARGWIQGAIPYKDLWDNKGPLLFLWYVASFLLLGENTGAPRLAAALAAVLSLYFLWAAVCRLFGSRQAAIAAIIFAFSFANVYLQVAANSEVFMLLPLTAGFWAFVLGARKWGRWWFFLSGFLTSLAVFTRQSAVLTFAAYAAWLAMLWRQQRESRSRQVVAIGALALGGACGALPFAIYFTVHGALYDLWYGMFGFNIGWVAEHSFWLKFVPPMFIEPGPLAGGLILWIGVLVGCRKLWKLGDPSARLVLLFLAASEAAAQIMGKGSAHYSIQLLPGAAVAAAFGFPAVLTWWKNGKFRVRAALAAAAIITVTAVLFAYLRPTAESRFRVQYTFRDYADDAINAPSIARVVAAISEPGQCVYEWGRSSQIYFLADRRPCSRWLYDRPFNANKSMISEVMADLRKRKPGLILITGEIPLPPDLAELMDKDYRYGGRVSYARLYRPTARGLSWSH